MSTALDHELEEHERQASAPQGPKQRGEATPVPTSVAAWKRDVPETHELPSGNVALLHRRSVMGMMRNGEIPNPMLDVALDAVQGERPKDFEKVAEFLDFMIASAFVEPKVSIGAEPAEDELPISALSDADRNYVLIWVQRGVAGLRSFRQDGESARDSGDGGGVRDEAE